MQSDPTPAGTVDVSVVVIGRNEGTRLIDCLRSVHAAQWTDLRYELIYVDSGSSDGSADHAAALGAHVICVQPVRPSAALGRNAGWRTAKAPLVLFLDGDTLLHPEFVNAAVQALRDHPERAAIWGHRRERYPMHSVFNRVLDLDWVYPAGDTAFCGGDALFSRSALAEVGGFNDSLIAGEEPELCARLRQRGWRIWHIDHPMTLHDLAITHWRQYWLRAERAGHAYAEVSHSLANTPTPLWNKENSRHRLHALALLLFILICCIAVFIQAFAAAGVLAGLALTGLARTAWRARWKGGSAMTLCLYALHAHAQQLPIGWGQLQWARTRRLGRARALIEYKRGAP
jgi:cellulose synthase/poly-beta-1,6-N-acetylglucosamine synthase-like glycosyltransferase